ncbi:MAG TPA: NAD-dependent epimerase/dehydratase family protein, partial [Rhizobiaceae bacterium]|nr:NAD-dependent epimerase/dehydratase family protein [Rhizobiaceae bacterium]
MRILLTGAAGFVGHHVAAKLLARGDCVTGIDNLNAYYTVALKNARLAALDQYDRFAFQQADIADPGDADALAAAAESADVVVHLAAQAGVRYSIENPQAYVHSNVAGQVAIFDLLAKRGLKTPVVYASSSSVYGGNEKTPFSETDPVNDPVSIYAATKRAGELIANAYRHTHGVASTGLRFFTVYGRYGRPDMAPWLFTDAILAGRPIQVFNHGEMERDFTHVSDIADGVVAAVDRIASRPGDTAPLYNLGNNSPVQLMEFIAAIEAASGRRAKLEMRDKPAGDVLRTYADIALAERDLGFSPKTKLQDGIAD